MATREQRFLAMARSRSTRPNGVYARCCGMPAAQRLDALVNADGLEAAPLAARVRLSESVPRA
jgi:hypothetical protein